jgi:hypothetical protein
MNADGMNADGMNADSMNTARYEQHSAMNNTAP